MRSGPDKALLFDIDGTLADTDAIHLEAFNRVFAPHGYAFDRARYAKELQGFSNQSIGSRFLAHEPPERQQVIMDEKEEAFRNLATDPIAPMPGLLALLDRADRAGVPMVAVTNAPRANVALILSGLGITHRFQGIIIGTELAHSKPHPLPYLEGLRLTGGVAAQSVAFEDSRAGVESASAAGLTTVGIRSGLSHDDLIAAGAHISAAAFDDPALLALLAAKMGW